MRNHTHIRVAGAASLGDVQRPIGNMFHAKNLNLTHGIATMPDCRQRPPNLVLLHTQLPVIDVTVGRRSSPFNRAGYPQCGSLPQTASKEHSAMSLFFSDDHTSTLPSSDVETTSVSSSSSVDEQAKKADLAGPGIGDYAELEDILPRSYNPLLTPRETQKAIFHLRRYIEDNLCKELGLQMVQVPLIVDVESGVNDMLDRDGSRTPIQFHISNDRNKNPIDAQVVQAATKWKRVALKQFDCRPGEGICTDMRAVRKDYFLDHDHSAYVDQWDWERVITAEQRNLEFLKSIVQKIWKVMVGAERYAQELFPQLKDSRYPDLPENLKFLHAEEILDMYPDLPRKQRETARDACG